MHGDGEALRQDRHPGVELEVIERPQAVAIAAKAGLAHEDRHDLVDEEALGAGLDGWPGRRALGAFAIDPRAHRLVVRIGGRTEDLRVAVHAVGQGRGEGRAQQWIGGCGQRPIHGPWLAGHGAGAALVSEPDVSPGDASAGVHAPTQQEVVVELRRQRSVDLVLEPVTASAAPIQDRHHAGREQSHRGVGGLRFDRFAIAGDAQAHSEDDAYRCEGQQSQPVQEPGRDVHV